MYAEWIDPYNIDDWHEEVGKIYEKVDSYVNPDNKITTQPTLTSISSAPIEVGIVENLMPLNVKSNFDVEPYSIFTDGHPVWGQPEYNILKSGPPEKYTEKYTESYKPIREKVLSYISREPIDIWDPLNIFLMIIIGILIIQIMRLNSTVNMHNILISMLLQNEKNISKIKT